MINQIHHNKMNVEKTIGALIAAALLCGVSAIGAVRASDKQPDKLVLQSSSSFSSQAFSVDLRANGVAKLRSCEALDASGNCKGPWRVAKRRVSAQERSSLARLASEANLFGGNTTGGQLDLAFVWLEVHSGYEIAILVTSLNDSFLVPGPRRQLLDALEVLKKQIASLKTQTES